MSADLKKSQSLRQRTGQPGRPRKKTLLGLNRASSHIRHEISSHLKTKSRPGNWSSTTIARLSTERGSKSLLDQTRATTTPDQ